MFLQFVVRAAQRAVVVEAERHCSILPDCSGSRVKGAYELPPPVKSNLEYDILIGG
jgi:hypothetical protein